MKKRIIHLLKLAWIIAVLVFIVLFFNRNYHELKEAVKQINFQYVVFSFLCITASKIMLVETMRLVVLTIGKDISFSACFRIYNISQLGKYLPGNIWHFVGKASAYKKRGFSLNKIRDALIVENAWLVLSSFMYGAFLMLIFNYSLLMNIFDSFGRYVLFCIAAISLGFFFAVKYLKLNISYTFLKHRLNFRILIIQIAVWSFLGLGFFVLTAPFLPEQASVPKIVGLYAIAYSIGFVTPFATAGIGVREAVLAFGLLPYMHLEIVIIVSVANRVIYLLVEILMASLSQLIPSPE